MENIEDITINGSVATWILPPTVGEVLGTYSGTFQFKTYLTPTEELEAGREYRALLGTNTGLATETEGQMGYALSQLKFRVLKAPPFWTSTTQDSAYAGNIPDLNILMLVFAKAFEAEKLFKEKLAKEREALLDRTIKIGEQSFKQEA